MDILINNAGVLDGAFFTDVSENVFMKIFQVNVISHFHLIKSFLPGEPLMRRKFVQLVAEKNGQSSLG